MDLQKIDLTKYPTLTLSEPLNFLDALKALNEGRCLGIRPEGNLRYIHPLFKLQGSCTVSTGNFLLRWNGEASLVDNAGLRSDQLLGNWYLVVIDYRAQRTPYPREENNASD